MQTSEKKSSLELCDEIGRELDRVSGVLAMVECLAGSEYQGADNALETLLANDGNGFMCLMNDTKLRFERARNLISGLHGAISAEVATNLSGATAIN